MIFARYRWHAGQVAFVVHRLSGVVLSLYIFAHLYVLSTIGTPERFREFIEFTHNPLIRLAEVGLLGVVAAHMLNGLRLTIMDTGAPTRWHKPLWRWAVALWCVVMLAGGAAMMGGFK